MGLFKKTVLGYEWAELIGRIERLEEKTFKKKRPNATLGQQILMLHHLGMLDHIYQLSIPNIAKAKMPSILLNADESNTKKFLEALPKKEEDELKIPFNYKFLKEVFDTTGLEELESKINSILNTLEANTKK